MCDELLVSRERLHRGTLAGFVPVEGKDDFAVECIMVKEYAAQYAGVVLTEGRAAGRNGGFDPGLMTRHDVGVTLDNDSLTR